MDNLLGADATPEQRQAMSLELRVDRETPPAFLWHTANDQVVQVENVLLMARALSGAGRPFELHVYPDGPHGMALSAENAHVGSWVPLAHEWLRTMGW
jgi:dipeptidyl aminopeptidase/acylaminoacyl peptidase